MPLTFFYNTNNIYDDVTNLLGFINDFTVSVGFEKVQTEANLCQGVINAMRDIDSFPHCDGLDKASPFKKVALFVCYFVSERPVRNEFSAQEVGENLAKITNRTNAILAFEVAIEALHGATLQTKEGEKTLANKIRVSTHSYTDIIEALSRATPSTHFQLVSVLLEQLAYKSNPDCQYAE